MHCTDHVRNHIIVSYNFCILLIYMCVQYVCTVCVVMYSICMYILVWKNGWQVISPKKSFAVFAATKTEKEEWMAHIRKCIGDLLSKGILMVNMCTRYIHE